MADQAVVHIGENSPEEVAYKLFRHVCAAEGKNPNHEEGGADRAYILQTYAECLVTIRDCFNRAKRAS